MVCWIKKIRICIYAESLLVPALIVNKSISDIAKLFNCGVGKREVINLQKALLSKGIVS
ncbi:hypothetical protein GO684_04620 [Wolbachia endosymbiont of Litomosoides brasiliensis]|nr:hypothetical protein [Wolbachia endosymbiont of Litomosoides brasiliensis]